MGRWSGLGNPAKLMKTSTGVSKTEGNEKEIPPFLVIIVRNKVFTPLPLKAGVPDFVHMGRQYRTEVVKVNSVLAR